MAYEKQNPNGQDTMTNSSPVVIASDQSAVPVSASSLPLPTGASTSAKQPALGTAGSASADVISVQGIASMTPLSSNLFVGGAVASTTNPVPIQPPASGTLAVDVAKMNGVAVTMGNGVSGTGVQRVSLASDSTGNIATIGTSVTPGTGSGNLGKAEDAVAGSGDTGVFSLSVANEAQTTLAADGDYIARSADIKGNSIVVGNIAHDTADAGNPIKVGGKAVNAEPTAVTANDRTNAIFDLAGRQIFAPHTNPENIVSGAITSAMTGTTSTSLVSAPGSGLRNYITTIIVSNAHATVGTDVIIQDGSGGTTLMTIPAAAVYGGAVINLPIPLRQPTTNTALYCANVTTGASTKVSAVGFKSAL